jgi:hypothetical protein
MFLFPTNTQREQCMKRLEEYENDLLGGAELARVLNKSQQNTSSFWQRRPDFPMPVELKQGPVWTRKQIKEWLE